MKLIPTKALLDAKKPTIAIPVLKNVATYDPLSTDDAAAGYDVGQFWYNTLSGKLWICVVVDTGEAKWRLLDGFTSVQVEEDGEKKFVLVPVRKKKPIVGGAGTVKPMSCGVQVADDIKMVEVSNQHANDDTLDKLTKKIQTELDKQVMKTLLGAAPPSDVALYNQTQSADHAKQALATKMSVEVKLPKFLLSGKVTTT